MLRQQYDLMFIKEISKKAELHEWTHYKENYGGSVHFRGQLRATSDVCYKGKADNEMLGSIEKQLTTHVPDSVSRF